MKNCKEEFALVPRLHPPLVPRLQPGNALSRDSCLVDSPRGDRTPRRARRSLASVTSQGGPWDAVRATAIALSLMLITTTRAEDSIEGKFLSNIRQVTSGFVKAGEGYFSPDGRQIVYQAQ